MTKSLKYLLKMGSTVLGLSNEWVVGLNYYGVQFMWQNIQSISQSKSNMDDGSMAPCHIWEIYIYIYKVILFLKKSGVHRPHFSWCRSAYVLYPHRWSVMVVVVEAATDTTVMARLDLAWLSEKTAPPSDL